MAFCYFPNHLFTGHNLITVYTSGENSVPSTYKFFSIALNKRITKVVTDFILKHQLVKSSKKKDFLQGKLVSYTVLCFWKQDVAKSRSQARKYCHCICNKPYENINTTEPACASYQPSVRFWIRGNTQHDLYVSLNQLISVSIVLMNST